MMMVRTADPTCYLPTHLPLIKPDGHLMIQFSLRQLFSLVPLFPCFYAGWNLMDRHNQSPDPGYAVEFFALLGCAIAGITIAYSKWQGKVINRFLGGCLPFAIWPSLVLLFFPLASVLAIIGICSAPGAVLASCTVLANQWRLEMNHPDSKPVQGWHELALSGVPILCLYGSVFALGGFTRAMGAILGF